MKPGVIGLTRKNVTARDPMAVTDIVVVDVVVIFVVALLFVWQSPWNRSPEVRVLVFLTH